MGCGGDEPPPQRSLGWSPSRKRNSVHFGWSLTVSENFWTFFCGRIRMKYKIRTIIVTCKISFYCVWFFRLSLWQNGWTDRDTAWQKFYKTANFLSRIFFAPGGPGPYQGPGPEASASPASWMIRPWATLCDPIWHVTLRSSEMGFLWRAVPFNHFNRTYLHNTTPSRSQNCIFLHWKLGCNKTQFSIDR